VTRFTRASVHWAERVAIWVRGRRECAGSLLASFSDAKFGEDGGENVLRHVGSDDSSQLLQRCAPSKPHSDQLVSLSQPLL